MSNDQMGAAQECKKNKAFSQFYADLAAYEQSLISDLLRLKMVLRGFMIMAEDHLHRPRKVSNMSENLNDCKRSLQRCPKHLERPHAGKVGFWTTSA